MSHDKNNPETPPTADRLTSYHDGELEPADRAAVANWLADNPDSAAEMEAWRRLAGLMQATAGPPPTPENWSKSCREIEVALAVRRRIMPGTYVKWAMGSLAAMAAAALFLLYSGGKIPGVKDQPFPVASDDDVVILSVNPEDVSALVVGHPPIVEAMILATPEDVTLVSAEPHEDGARPDMWWEAGASPLIVPSDKGDGR